MGVIRGSVEALYRNKDGAAQQKPAELVAIPYYANCNREPCEMLVWLTETRERAEPRLAADR